MNRVYFIVASLCVAGLLVRTSYELLKKVGRVDTRNKAIFAMVFIAMCAMLAGWPAMSPLDPWRVIFPGTAQWLGLVVVITALTFAIGGLMQLRGLENVDHLVTTGLFSRFRHPMYTGFILGLLAG
ncbi:MAG: hypothetical protein ACWGQW_25630 [bacterium]